MKKNVLFTGILAAALVFALALAGCSNPAGDSDPLITLPAAKGAFTLNGASAYDGKYAIAVGSNGNNDDWLYGVAAARPESGTLTGVKIAGGTVTLNLYTYDNDGNVTAYEGSDTVPSFIIFITESPTIVMSGSFGSGTVEVDFGSVTFSGGSATKAVSEGTVSTY